MKLNLGVIVTSISLSCMPLSAHSQETRSFFSCYRNIPESVISQIGDYCLITTAHSFPSNRTPQVIGTSCEANRSDRIPRNTLDKIAQEGDVLVFKDKAQRITQTGFGNSVGILDGNRASLSLNTFRLKNLNFLGIKEGENYLGYVINSQNQAIPFPNCNENPELNSHCLDEICSNYSFGACEIYEKNLRLVRDRKIPNSILIPGTSGTPITSRGQIVGVQSGYYLNSLGQVINVAPITPNLYSIIRDECFN